MPLLEEEEEEEEEEDVPVLELSILANASVLKKPTSLAWEEVTGQRPTISPPIYTMYWWTSNGRYSKSARFNWLHDQRYIFNSCGSIPCSSFLQNVDVLYLLYILQVLTDHPKIIVLVLPPDDPSQ